LAHNRFPPATGILHLKFNRFSRVVLLWIATPFVAVGGFGLGIVACSALQGAIAFFNFVPFVPNLLWLSGAATTYLSASLASSFAVSCAPSMHQKVRWLVLVPIFIYQLLQVCSIPAAEKSVQNWFGAYAIEGFVVISWLMFKAWKKPL
jgi:hypothetical protein